MRIDGIVFHEKEFDHEAAFTLRSQLYRQVVHIMMNRKVGRGFSAGSLPAHGFLELTDRLDRDSSMSHRTVKQQPASPRHVVETMVCAVAMCLVSPSGMLATL